MSTTRRNFIQTSATAMGVLGLGCGHYQSLEAVRKYHV